MLINLEVPVYIYNIRKINNHYVRLTDFKVLGSIMEKEKSIRANIRYGLFCNYI